MKRDCSTCICKEGSCYSSTTIFDKDKNCKSYDPDYEGYIAELEKENADLKCECRRCVYTDSPCILSDYGKDRNGICDHFKDVFDEVAELKEELKRGGGKTNGKSKFKRQLMKVMQEPCRLYNSPKQRNFLGK